MVLGFTLQAFFEDAERLAHACNIRLSAVDGGKVGPITAYVLLPFRRKDNIRGAWKCNVMVSCMQLSTKTFSQGLK